MTKKSASIKRHLLPILTPLLCALVFTVLASLNLTSSIWFDESYSAYLTRGSFVDIWNLTAQDVHPPLFYFLLKIWSSIFGTTDFAMRFMSVFFGVIAIILVFHLIKRFFGFKAAALSTFLLSISPIFIRYGQEMRMYTLVFAIVLAATYILDLALETHKKRYYILYAILLALGMWTHYFTAVAWIAHIIYYMVTRRANLFSKPMILTYLLAVVLYLPWIPSFFQQIDTVQGGFWVQSVTPATIAEYITETTIFAEVKHTTDWLAVLVIAVVIFTTICAVKVYRKLKKSESQNFLFLLALVILPPAILVLLSLPPLSPMFVPRYLLYAAALTWVFIGVIITIRFQQITPNIIKATKHKIKIDLSDIILPAGLLALTLTAAIIGIVNVTNRIPGAFVKPVILDIKAINQDRLPIVADNEWTYYDAVFYDSETTPIYGITDQIGVKYGSLAPIHSLRHNLIDDLDQFMSEHPKFWYLVSADRNTKIEDIKLPSDDLEITTELTTDHYIVLELTKITHCGCEL